MVYVLIESIVLGPEPETWAWFSNPILDLRSHPSEKDDRDDSVGIWLPLTWAQKDEFPFML